jgi:hypothetical protein
VTLPDVEQLVKSVSALDVGNSKLEEAEHEMDAPIFLLSTGWRAGSTLLQRILVTDPHLLLWGEPLGEMVLLSRMAEMLSHPISDRNLNLWRNQAPIASASLASSWIANLYPPGDSFRSGLRSIFDLWLGRPAKEQGFSRWGFKEVRIGASEAILLHWLYPKAKFLVISRHPYDCYQSLVDAGWCEVYYRYPDAPIDSAVSFGRHWNRVAVSWSQLPSEFPVVKIKYEEMIAGKVDFRELESWLGIKIHETAALSASVGKTATRTGLNWYERLIISREAAPGMLALGYSKLRS